MLTYDKVPGSPTPEYRWTLGRSHGHVWRHWDTGQWVATISGFSVCGKGKTRRTAIVDATRKGLRSVVASHPSL